MKTHLACLRNWGRNAVNKIKGSRLRLFLRSKGYYSIIIWSGQFLFNPLSPSSSLTFSALVRALEGWFLWSTAPWLPCPLLSYFVWSVENRDISFFLSLLWFSVPLWLPCMTAISFLVHLCRPCMMMASESWGPSRACVAPFPTHACENHTSRKGFS